ncbi:MAG: T9SS type A sorting domain-containing protein [Flavobacteriaceae bacterium]|nr:T9SS type A sorting domain-containing protein [Flavobacteriaceae bacterium]
MRCKLLFLLLIIVSALSFGQTVTINGTSYGTISAAITAASNNDVIVITGVHTESINISDKSLILRGTNPTTDIIQAAASSSTDGTGSRVINLSGTATITIENLGIRYGNNSDNGAGINIDKVTGLVTLKNLVIENNFTSSNGGGLAIAGSNINIIGCTIKGNTSSLDGGGILAAPNNAATTDITVSIQQSLISANTGRNGGGMYINGNNGFGDNYKIDVNIENSTIESNAATTTSTGNGGGGIWTKSADYLGTGGGTNVTLKLVHVTMNNNTHAADNKEGLQFTKAGTNNANFSAYNSILVNTDAVANKAVNFANTNTVEVINCILGGINSANTGFLDNAARNNVRGKTATFAGISGGLTSAGGLTQVLSMDKDQSFKNYCTASTGITLPGTDQRNYLRGTTPDAGAFEYYNIWTGATDTNWATAGNWEDGLPTTGDVVHIKSAVNMPIASDAIDVANIVMDSGTSFITTSTYSGGLVYHRTLATNNWYLVSSPVVGQDEDDFVTNAILAHGSGGNRRGFSTYDTANNGFSYYSGDTGANNLGSGTGYSIKKGSAGDITFSGTMNTSDVPISVVTGGTDSFNLIGNPYPSHINSASFLSDNTANLVVETLWVWNQSSGNYETKISGDNFVLAPAQGFFVRASSSTDLNMLESYQTSSGGTFQKQSKTEVKLLMTDGTSERFTKFYYLDTATKGFDNGWDGETFKGQPNALDVFSHLLEDNVGDNYQVQSLPKTDMETFTIPIGIKANAGKELTFTAEAINLPSELKVYLEDRENNTFNELTTTSNYKATVNDALDGIGRFFLHTRSSALSTNDIGLEGIGIYTINRNTLRVSGVNSINASLKMYNILGKKVLETSLPTKGISDVVLPKLITGIYIVHLQTEKGKINKKIVVE